ncbi:MAG TPA: VTT domain-containing protein [Bacillales bacterium]|nr:VTT domain-containing protein [Bacillales bacterium]
MDKVSGIVFEVLQTSGMFAPLAFIILHVMRQFVFVPVSLICMLGGVFFGVLYGTLYSLIGLTLASIWFYLLFKRMPSWFRKVQQLKEKCFKKRAPLSFGQMAILRLIPFVHFHLISLCLIEATSDFKAYTKNSMYANLPLAVVYTMFGQWIGRLSPEWIVLILACLLVLFYSLRTRQWTIKWNEFFEARST